jgi:MFS family permease
VSARPLTKPSAGFADLSVRLAIALAFADASVAVLALPQIVIRLHTTISHVTWVITAYNLALIATAVAIVPLAPRLAPRRTLITGLAIFGLASIGSGTADSLTALVPWRCLQGVGGGLLVSASLPLLRSGRGGRSAVLQAWAVTAAIGAGVGPAVGGILTQLFDWRAIFLAQAPVAAAAAFAIAVRAPETVTGAEAKASPQAAEPGPRTELSPSLANVALAFVSAGLIGALFLATVLLINVWQISPLGAAAVLLVIPLATVVTERLVLLRQAPVLGAAGAVVLAAGLAFLALLTRRQVGLAVVALGLCGIGLGLAFPALTRVALQTRGALVARAARTVAAREGGLVLGLVLLTPVLVNQLSTASTRATPQVAAAVINAPISLLKKFELGAGLVAADRQTPQSQLPDFRPAFAQAAVGESVSTVAHLAQLEAQVQSIVQRAVTHSFREPLLLCALLSLLALVPLAYGTLSVRRQE